MMCEYQRKCIDLIVDEADDKLKDDLIVFYDSTSKIRKKYGAPMGDFKGTYERMLEYKQMKEL